MTIRYSFKINGTEIGYADGAGANLVLTDGTKIDLTRENQNGNIARLRVPADIRQHVDISSGSEVIISRGIVSASDNIIFKGNIKGVEVESDNTIILICTDPLQKLKYDLFIESYDKNIDPEAGELSEIFKDIAEQGGFSVSRIRSGTSAGSIVVDKFISRNQSRLNRLNLIQKILNWIFYYDYQNDFIRLEPKGYVLHPTPQIVGTNIVNIPNWDEDIESMRNKITVEGAKQLDTRSDSFVGTGAQTEFELTYTPESIEVTVAGTLQVLGVPSASETYDYSLDRDLKTITFVSAPAGSAAIVAKYTTYIPTPVTGESSESIARYGLTQHESYKFEDVVTIADAEIRVNQLLNAFEFGDSSAIIQTTDLNVKVGSKIDYSNPIDDSFNGQYVVESKVINYGQEFDTIKIGTPKIDIHNIFNTIDERLRLLEGSDQELASILRNLIKLVRPRMQLVRKSQDWSYRNVVNSAILDHATLGRFRSGKNIEADCSDNGNHGTWTGTGVTTGAQYSAPYESGGEIITPCLNLSCGTFNGTDQMVTSNTTSILKNSDKITVFCAFEIASLGTGRRFITRPYGSNDGSRNGSIQTNSSNKVLFYIRNVSGTNKTLISTTSITTGEVYTVFARWDPVSGDAELYLNGILEDSDSLQGTPATQSNSFIVGNSGDSSNIFFDGNIDEVMIFNTYEPTSTMEALIANKFYKFHESYSNLKLWWSFDNPVIGNNKTVYIPYETGEVKPSNQFPLSFPIELGG